MTAVKVLAIGAMVVAMAALSMFIASRLSDEAIMTIVGVFCGIVASIPVSIGLLIALTREREDYSAEPLAEPSAPRARVSVNPVRSIALADWRIRQYIVTTGTVPENSSTRVWRQVVDNEECVFWQNSESPQIHYAPLRMIASGQSYDA